MHTGGSVLQCSQDASGSNYVSLFVIGQILHGVGGGAIFTLGSPYMDENIRTENTPLYIGELYNLARFGLSVYCLVAPLIITTIMSMYESYIPSYGVNRSSQFDVMNNTLYLCTGLMQMFAMFGPALGFMGGGLLLTNYVDFTRVDMSQ